MWHLVLKLCFLLYSLFTQKLLSFPLMFNCHSYMINQLLSNVNESGGYVGLKQCRKWQCVCDYTTNSYISQQEH